MKKPKITRFFKVKMPHGQEIPRSNTLTQMLREKNPMTNLNHLIIHPDKFIKHQTVI